jgi:hypothetical protein
MFCGNSFLLCKSLAKYELNDYKKLFFSALKNCNTSLSTTLKVIVDFHFNIFWSSARVFVRTQCQLFSGLKIEFLTEFNAWKKKKDFLLHNVYCLFRARFRSSRSIFVNPRPLKLAQAQERRASQISQLSAHHNSGLRSPNNSLRSPRNSFSSPTHSFNGRLGYTRK